MVLAKAVNITMNRQELIHGAKGSQNGNPKNLLIYAENIQND